MGGLSLLGAVFMLALVLVLAYWCSRLLGGKWNRISAGGKKIRVVEQIPLGPDKRLLVVRYGGKEYLLGAAQGGITLIDSRKAEDEVTEITEPPLDFSGMLRHRFRREERKGDRNE